MFGSLVSAFSASLKGSPRPHTHHTHPCSLQQRPVPPARQEVLPRNTCPMRPACHSLCISTEKSVALSFEEQGRKGCNWTTAEGWDSWEPALLAQYDCDWLGEVSQCWTEQPSAQDLSSEPILCILMSMATWRIEKQNSILLTPSFMPHEALLKDCFMDVAGANRFSNQISLGKGLIRGRQIPSLQAFSGPCA